MATHDYVIANASGAAVRADLNNALAAIVSNNSGSSEPGTTYAFQWWADTNASQLKLRNAANDDWVVIQELDGTLLMENGTVGSPGLAFASDLDTGFFRPAANQLAIATNGVERVEFGTTEVVFNDGGNDIDLRVEGDTNANLFLVDAGNDRVNIGGTIQVAGSRGGSLQPSDNDSLELFTSATSGDANTGCGLTFFNHDGSGSEMGGTIQVAKENGTDDNTASYMRFATRTNGSAAAERVRIDSSGRLLVGTSSGSSEPIAAFQGRSTDASDGAMIALTRSGATPSGTIGIIQFATGSDFAKHFATIISASDGTVSSSSTPGHLRFSTTASSSTNASEAMRIDSGGRVLVGTSSNFVRGQIQAIDSGGGEITIGRADTSVASGNDLGHLFFASNDSGTGVAAANISCFAESDHTSSSAPVNLRFNVCASSSTSPTERMRLDSNGLVSTFSSGNSTNYKIFNSGSSSSSIQFISCFQGASDLVGSGGPNHKFSVNTNGGIQNFQGNDSNLCDEREKKNIVDLEAKWDEVKSWELRKFHYNDDVDTDNLRYGVIAQQVETICPEVIVDWKKQDAEEAVLDDKGKVVKAAQEEVIRKGVKEQQMMWMAIKALQEAQTRIETLETKVAALEAG